MHTCKNLINLPFKAQHVQILTFVSKLIGCPLPVFYIILSVIISPGHTVADNRFVTPGQLVGHHTNGKKYQSLQITPKDKNVKGVKITQKEKKAPKC